MKKNTVLFSLLFIALLLILVTVLVILLSNYKDADPAVMQILIGITGLAIIFTGYFYTRFKVRDWIRNKRCQ